MAPKPYKNVFDENCVNSNVISKIILTFLNFTKIRDSISENIIGLSKSRGQRLRNFEMKYKWPENTEI